MTENKQGKLIIFSAPSGSGKTTLVHYVMSKIPYLSFSISAASRKKRVGEKDGKDYYFITADQFRSKIKYDEFIEWEEVYTDHYYGTLKTEVERIRNSGKHVAFDVDVIGGLNIKKQFGSEALAVFVKPPSVDVLKERLKNRATDSAEAIRTRIEKAESELAFENQFDVVIINDDLETAKQNTLETIQAFLSR